MSRIEVGARHEALTLTDAKVQTFFGVFISLYPN